MWRDLLPRLRFVDLGPNATFGLRHVAKIEGFEICCLRPSDDGPPVLEYAAALLHALGVTPETPTWEVAELLKRTGLGPPYGRAGSRSPEANEARERARQLLAERP